MNGRAVVLPLAALVAIIAAVEVAVPFTALLHAWWFALAVTLAGVALMWFAAAAVTRRRATPSALAGLGGALLAACVAYAAFIQGQPERVPAAPGQVYLPPHGAGVEIAFPTVEPTGPAGIVWPNAVTVRDAFGTRTVGVGETARAAAFVLRVDSGPIALIDARDLAGKPVTTTQPDGAAFLSPYLTFGGLDGDKPEDYFAVPALHRTVQVDYWAGLPSRGIDVPFLVLRIAEENGGSLYEGVAVSGRPLKRAGVALTFTLGAYPVVTATSAPPLVPFWAGVVLVLAGCVGKFAGLEGGSRSRLASVEHTADRLHTQHRQTGGQSS